MVMPVRNGARYISHSIKMLIENSKFRDEIIVIDDGSTDNTHSEIMKLRNKADNLRVLKTRGIGIVGALNLGILEAINPVIARFDVDDVYPATRLDSQRGLIRGETIGAFSDYKFIDSSGELSLGIMPSAIYPSAVALSLVNSQRTAHPSVVFTKMAWEAAGGYREEDFPTEDLSLWLRMLRFGNLVSVPEINLNYRIHSSSVTSSNRKIIEAQKEELIKHIGFSSSTFKDVNWMEIYNSYEDLVLGPERRVLLLYDYLTLMRKKKIFFERNGFEIRPLLVKRNLTALVNLQRDRKLRQVYRNNLKSNG